LKFFIIIQINKDNFCKFGNSCHFAHTDKDLKSANEITQLNTIATAINFELNQQYFQEMMNAKHQQNYTESNQTNPYQNYNYNQTNQNPSYDYRSEIIGNDDFTPDTNYGQTNNFTNYDNNNSFYNYDQNYQNYNYVPTENYIPYNNVENYQTEVYNNRGYSYDNLVNNYDYGNTQTSIHMNDIHKFNNNLNQNINYENLSNVIESIIIEKPTTNNEYNKIDSRDESYMEQNKEEKIKDIRETNLLDKKVKLKEEQSNAIDTEDKNIIEEIHQNKQIINNEFEDQNNFEKDQENVIKTDYLCDSLNIDNKNTYPKVVLSKMISKKYSKKYLKNITNNGVIEHGLFIKYDKIFNQTKNTETSKKKIRKFRRILSKNIISKD